MYGMVIGPYVKKINRTINREQGCNLCSDFDIYFYMIFTKRVVDHLQSTVKAFS